MATTIHFTGRRLFSWVRRIELADYVDNEVPVLAEKVFKKAQYPTISISGQAFPIGKTGK